MGVGGNVGVGVAVGCEVAVGRGTRVGVGVRTIITGPNVRSWAGKGVSVGTKTGVIGVLVTVGGGGVVVCLGMGVTPAARVAGGGVLVVHARAPKTIKIVVANTFMLHVGDVSR